MSVEIATASVQTDTGKRDEHLKSGDFFSIEEYPTITFTSTAVRRTGGTGFELDGDLDDQGRHEAGHVDRRVPRRRPGHGR